MDIELPTIITVRGDRKMTNGEKIQKDFKGCEVCEPIVEDDIIHVIFADKKNSAIGFDWSWWNAEYKEPTTKNDLGVELISKADALDCVNWGYNFSDIYKKINDLPSVTPQESRWIPVSEKKPNKGGEYLLWGKIDESEEEDYCFVGDYYEFEEKFGTEISNYDPNTLGFIDTEIEEYYSVIAWMPLPKAYSEV
jgi:hypothetical protein